MDQKGIDRINELARKAKTVGLTPEEKEEQRKLRSEFIASIRMNLRSQLDHIDIQGKRWLHYKSGRKIWKQNKSLGKKSSKEEKRQKRRRS